MEVVEIEPGLWRWTGYHEEWKRDVGCVYLETADEICLIDPLVPPEERERFWRALDGDVKKVGGDVHVLITVRFHARSAREVVGRYGAQLWAPSRGRAAVERRAGPVAHAFRPGDELPGGVEAFRAVGSEVVYWIPAHGALVFGDVLLGDGEGGVQLCPAGWLPTGSGHSELRAALTPLLDLKPRRLLVSHGESVLAGGAAALRAALER